MENRIIESWKIEGRKIKQPKNRKILWLMENRKIENRRIKKPENWKIGNRRIKNVKSRIQKSKKSESKI